ncbi:MAG: hypothetical protein AAGK22_27930 [Acidobacteriota bacterium]
MSNSTQRPLLSFVLCSRNDEYAGNSLWRLNTALNYLAEGVSELGAEGDFEVIVSDWGSEIPLREALHLSAAAQAITSFLEVPRELVDELQGESPFAEVLANNAAIRRARGQFIGRIDQDTLVGKKFLQRFREHIDDDDRREGLSKCFLFVRRRHIPFAFARHCHSLAQVRRFIRLFGSVLPKEGRRQRPWFDAPVGIAMLHRDLWEECRGYDESLLYWGFMETDLGLRVRLKSFTVRLEKEVGCTFYHLAHSQSRFAVTKRRKNPRRPPEVFAPSGEDWGLSDRDLPLVRGTIGEGASPFDELPEKRGAGLLMRYSPSVLNEQFWESLLAVLRNVRNLSDGERLESESPR